MAASCTNGAYDVASRTCGSGSDGNAYNTIAEAILRASPGDIVNIRTGTYDEFNITVRFAGASMTIIQAYNFESVLIRNSSVDKPTFKLDGSADNIMFKNLELIGTRTSPDGFAGIGIGNTSSINGYIIIDNCVIHNFAHVGIKGGYRWWIKHSKIYDIGTDSQDHGIYSYGQHTEGEEPIFEYNQFHDITGSGIQIYYHGNDIPGRDIVRYNLIWNCGRSGIQLGKSFCKIYNNTVYSSVSGIVFGRDACHDNDVKNNIFDGNSNNDLYVDSGGPLESYPMNNSVENNFLGSSKTCAGCNDQTGNGGDDYSVYDDYPPNVVSPDNPFISDSPSTWKDFRLSANSPCINSGANLGPSHGEALDPSDTPWPLFTSEQDDFGSGWEIGAFLFKVKPDPPKNLNIIN